MFRSMTAVLCMALFMGVATESFGQNPNYPGYLGVRVYGHRYGMQIKSFIPNTPAADLARQGGISRHDVITQLGNYRTRTMSDLLRARDQIPDGTEAKMVLRDTYGDYYFVWIGRNDEAVAASSAGGPEPAMSYRRGGSGQGNPSENYRPQGSSGSGGSGNYRPKY